METVRCVDCGARNRVPAVATGKPACGSCRSPLPWITHATAATFDASIAASVPVLVDLWAQWCGPCRTVAPILKQLASDRAGRLKIVKVDVDRSPELSDRFSVQGIPTLLLFVGGDLAGRVTGAMPLDRLSRWLDTTLSNDGDASDRAAR